tara:strand:+ start:202 stop:663 length:462 start_codon:yes stop_codon:yes gene_type:complete
MPLPAAPLLVALATAARVGSRVAIRAGTKLYRGTAKAVKSPKRFSKVKYLRAKALGATAVSETKKHAKFYKRQLLPGGTEPNKAFSKQGFKRLIKRPTFGETRPLFDKRKYGMTGMDNIWTKVNTKGKKTRSKLTRAGIYGGYIGAYKAFGDD